MSATRSVLIAGVGGQGVVLAGHILAAACLSQGLQVKKSDVHGMAQRGGIVYSHVRFGQQVASPMIEEGRTDALVALEWAEALRWTPYLRPGAVVIVDTAQIIPPLACRDRRTWRSRYPQLDAALLAADDRDLYLVDAGALARSAGAARAANVVLLGALSTRIPFPVEAWEDAIRQFVPAGSVEANLKAFARGRALLPGHEVATRPPPPPQQVSRFTVEVVEAWCKGCDICVRVCPEDCLRLDEHGIVRVIDAGRCTGCRLCQLLCPDFAITVRTQEEVRSG